MYVLSLVIVLVAVLLVAVVALRLLGPARRAMQAAHATRSTSTPKMLALRQNLDELRTGASRRKEVDAGQGRTGDQQPA